MKDIDRLIELMQWTDDINYVEFIEKKPCTKNTRRKTDSLSRRTWPSVCTPRQSLRSPVVT